MKKKSMLWIIAVLLAFVVIKQSFYIKKLDELQASLTLSSFDAATYVDTLWQEKLPKALATAVPLQVILNGLNQNPSQTIEKYSKGMGIGYIRYFLVKGTAAIVSNKTDATLLQLEGDQSASHLLLQTEYIYGNAARDASGLVDMTTFKNTNELNLVSQEINNRIREKVLQPYKAHQDRAEKVEFVAAIEINSKFPSTDPIEMIPLNLQIVDK
ncbi:DUF2291 domain-containing protein [Sphingobacterium suaedae]|uniref:DUF2291 domain-containing protein n=1 Tax=Sphingobacterium suaedae TaxID=1686402 RepID=A0ABW5KHA3_9SPHI